MVPKKKKLTKKERQKLADELEKAKKAQVEQERLRLLKEEKERIEREKKIAQEKVRREIAEQILRHEKLRVCCEMFDDLKKKKAELERNLRMQDEWDQFLKCDGLPDPQSFSQLNTYLFLWKKENFCPDIEEVLEKTEEVLNIRSDMRSQQQNRLDMATYKLLQNIDKNLEMIDMVRSKYTLDSPRFIMNIWNATMLPTSVAGANEVKQSFTLEFPNIGVSLLLPASVAGINLSVRALWLKYDHISDNCRTYDCPLTPDSFAKNLDEITLEEWALKTELQKQFDEYEESIETATAEELLSKKPKKSLSEMMKDEEESEIQQWKREMITDNDPHEVNLRKFTVLGGVFYLDLLQQPSQPRELSSKRKVTLKNIPEGLTSIPYYEHYVPPPPPEPGARRTPEEIEVEVKEKEKALEKLAAVTVAEEAEKPKKPADDLKREMENEKELQKLVVVTVDLPETVLWFEQPMAANWDPKKNYWSTEEIHDLKFNEDKQTLTFRTGRMGLMALACYRYCNFPYQTWEMKPDVKSPEGGVLLNITAAVAIIEFLIRDGKVSVNQLQNGTTNALQEHVGIFYRPKKLIKILQDGGVDIFPPPDVFCYLDGVVLKHRAAENHLYQCMALMSISHNFSWSRWNLPGGRRNIVLQMREFLERKHLPNYSVLHVTPLKALIVDCSEVSANFNEQGVEGMKVYNEEFYPDLYSLAMEHSSKQAKEKIENIPFNLWDTVREMLCATRPLSFS